VRALPHPSELEKVTTFTAVVIKSKPASDSVTAAIREMCFDVRRCRLL
jgi:hypothetical protein